MPYVAQNEVCCGLRANFVAEATIIANSSCRCHISVASEFRVGDGAAGLAVVQVGMTPEPAGLAIDQAGMTPELAGLAIDQAGVTPEPAWKAFQRRYHGPARPVQRNPLSDKQLSSLPYLDSGYGISYIHLFTSQLHCTATKSDLPQTRHGKKLQKTLSTYQKTEYICRPEKHTP